MKHEIRCSRIASAACVVTMACVPASALAETSTAEAGWAKMTQCATIGDDETRHACTDKTLREAGLLSDETRAAAQRKAFGLPRAASTVAPIPAPPAAAPVTAASSATSGAAAGAAGSSAPASPSGSAALPRKQSESLEVTLAKVEQGGDGKLMLTTTEGAVWRQVESGAIPQRPAQGQTMKIEARSLGGFMCEPSKYVSFRCYRSK